MKREIFAFLVALLAFPTISFSQTSPDGSTIEAPTNNTLTDAGNVWGLAGSDPAYPLDFYVTMNGQLVQAQGYPAGTFWSMSELLILNNGQLYATDNNYGGGAYQWNGATFTQIASLPSGGGSSQTSPDGSTIGAPTNNTLTDASGNVWGFATSDPAAPLDFYVTMNGQLVQAQGYPAGTFWSMSELLILNNGQLYAVDGNYGGGPYQWNGATFTQIASLPSGGSTTEINLVQAQSATTAPVSGQQCTLTFSNRIGSGNTVVGFVHSSNNTDTSPMTPDFVLDNNNVAYVLARAVQWLPWPEDINIFYLTNVQGNPTSFTFDFSNYSSPPICNVGFAEYSGVSSVAISGPTLVSGTSPSITISPTSTALIWALAADYASGGGGSLLTNSGYNVLIDNFSFDNIDVWGSASTVPAGDVTLTWHAPGYNASPCPSGVTCPTTLAAVALQ